MNRKDIVNGLNSLGLKEGDIVLLHSSLASLGYVEGGAEAVVEAFLETLGESGTLVVPVFGSLGIITDMVKNHPKSVISNCPCASVAAIGADAEAICAGHWDTETAHGEDTPYLKIAQKDGYVCLMGVDQDRNTTLHSVEALLRLPYLQTVTRTKETEDGEITGSWDYFPGPHRDFIGLDKYLRQSGKMTTSKIGNSVVKLIKSRELIDICCDIGRRNPEFVLCDNPNCADCVSQKAAIKRHRFSGESFSLAVSASLAGSYVPEIIENMKASGIDAVELDIIQGQPVSMISDANLKKAVDEFRENDIEISALKIPFVPENMDKIMEKALDNNVSRIVMPLSADSSEYLKKASEKNIHVTFYNKGIDSDKASSILMEMKSGELKPKFAFSPSEFASCGEKPFLGSYKKKLRRFISQLYIEDALFDSSPACLAEGNAEIKEMISILRCSSFSGFFVFSALNGRAGTLEKTIKSFECLLENM